MVNNTSRVSLSRINYITGVSDGLLLPIIPCGLISLYFSNIKNENYWSILFGWYLITTFIGALVYGFARYLGEKNEIKHNHPDIAKAELLTDKERLLQIGIDGALATEMMQRMEEEHKDWLKEIKENNMDWEHFDNVRAARAGMQTGVGFVIGAFLVLLPFSFFYFHFLNEFDLFLFYVFSEFIIMFSFGWLKGKYLQKNAMRLAIYQVLMSVWILIVFFVGAIILLSLYE